ncbi:MAG TPA: hypothetical protein VIJ15_09615 [Dermatophilaceae bacterium]
MPAPAADESSLNADELGRFHDDLQAEYVQLVNIVSSFDQRLLTIKGWGVTLSLASLGLGFQQGHYGLFLVAAASGFAFWALEATTKQHQMRYYPRMGDIESIAYEVFGVETPIGRVSSPLIDWAWWVAVRQVRKESEPGWSTMVRWVFGGRRKEDIGRDQRDPRRPHPWPIEPKKRPLSPWFFPHVMLPHLIAVIMGIVLFVLGLLGVFGPI